MYAPVRTTRPVLISPQEVILNTPAGAAVIAHDKVLQAIEIAEERFVRRVLGYDLYEAIVASKNVVVTGGNIDALQDMVDVTFEGLETITLKAGDVVNAAELLTDPYKLLWSQRLCKYTAECVRFIAIPENFLQFTNQGLLKNNPVADIMGAAKSESVGATKSDVQWLLDKTMERIEVLADSLHEYICKNATAYPLYDKKCATGNCRDGEGPVLDVLGGVVFPDFYADQDREREGCNRW